MVRTTIFVVKLKETIMKIRIKGNSVRFRLTQSEVKTLATEGKIFDSTNFGTATFTYGVVLTEELDSLGIQFQNASIILEMPKKEGISWHENDIVTFDHHLALNDTDLYLLLEKDFTCLDNTLEDQSDNYPNPKMTPS